MLKELFPDGKNGTVEHQGCLDAFSLVFQKPGDFHVMFCWGGIGSSPFPVELHLSWERAVHFIIKTMFEDVQSSFLAAQN